MKKRIENKPIRIAPKMRTILDEILEEKIYKKELTRKEATYPKATGVMSRQPEFEILIKKMRSNRWKEDLG